MTVEKDAARENPVPARESVLSAEYRWISIGMCALVFLAAFEAMAVTAVMPVVAADLDGRSLYALAFAGPLAVSVIGMIVAGNASDRGGPRIALYSSVVLFVIGLLIAGTATGMWQLVIGRLLHGIGGGGLTVALYVIVARVLPQTLQPSIFAGFAAAWVLPSLIGPFVAGVVADTVGWQWVFLGVVALVVPALIMVVPSLRGMSTEIGGRRPPWRVSRGRHLPPSRSSC
jgi:MFS family permease